MTEKEDSPLTLDLHNLHLEAQRQAQLYKKWSDKLANAANDATTAKSAVELAEADLMLKINKSPGKYGLEKTTGPLLEAAVIVQSEYQKAVEAQSEAEHRRDTLKGMVTALDHKKKMIELEVQLFLSSYFGEPRVKGGDSNEINKRSARKPLKGKNDD